jgi:predicted nucleotidyltransferase
MLTHEKISEAVMKAAVQFSVTKAEYFGSYANGTATEDSDLDLLVEFDEPIVCLLHQIGLKYFLEDELGKSVDVIHAPIPKSAIIQIDRKVRVL